MARTISPPRTSTPRSSPTPRHPSSSTPATNTNTTIVANIHTSPTSQRAADRPVIPIVSAASNTSSPIYSTTSSPISPGISQYPANSLGIMAPSRSDPRTSALAMELPPTSTPTGRISKAKKGKRVHACEFPGCGKIFTRAEHRRRHELNHNPDATYRCSQPGCGKSFHRLDLLQRHQERHELEASTQPSSPGSRRYPTHSAVLPEPPSAMPASSMSSPPMARAPPRTSTGGMSIPNLINNSYVSEPSGFPMHFAPYYTTGEPWDTVYVTDAMNSPMSRGRARQNISSASSVVSFDPNSGSPMVTASMPQQNWTQALPPNVLPANMFEDGMSPYPSLATVNPTPLPLSQLDANEWSFIGRELSAVSGLLPNDERSGVPDTWMRWHCLDLYWRYFHPTYPIVHRPTSTKSPPPLLSAAMVAIGSYYDTRDDAKKYSLDLLEIAIKALRQRPISASKKSRIMDLQTVVLLEIFSTFCARQISVQISGKFRHLFADLHSTPAQSPLAVFRTLKEDRSMTKLAGAQRFWIELETKNRVRHACSVLDSQQTILFEQPPTVHRHSHPRVDIARARPVYLPCHDNLWDATSVQQWAEIAERHEYVQLAAGRPVISPGNRQVDYSYFQQQIINANSDGVLKCDPPAKMVSVTSDERLSKSEFDYHATWMCKHTPIQSLLVVVGESWLLGRKAEKAADYRKAKNELRKWAEGMPIGKKSYSDNSAAHWHALKLLRILQLDQSHRTNATEVFDTTHMLHENWVVYLATLICWTQGQRKGSGSAIAQGVQHVSGTHLGNGVGAPYLSASIVGHNATTNELSCFNDAIRAAQEAETYLLFTDVSSPAALHDLDVAILTRTQGLLESVRSQKISKHMIGGLMNDAEQVLLKLVDGTKSIAF